MSKSELNDEVESKPVFNPTELSIKVLRAETDEELSNLLEELANVVEYTEEFAASVRLSRCLVLAKADGVLIAAGDDLVSVLSILMEMQKEAEIEGFENV